jgi:site-specific recombinase XerC
MTPFLKKTSKCWFITVPTKEGTYERLSSGTRDWDTAVAMQDMMTALGRRGSRNWDVIDWVLEQSRPTAKGLLRWPGRIATVFDHYPERLADLRALILDEDLAPAIDRWDAELDVRENAGDLAPATVAHYRRQVNWLFPKDDETEARLPVRRSTVTPAFIKTKLGQVTGSSTNKRRHAAGWNSLMSYLVEAGKLDTNPIASITLPANNKTKRPRIERLEDVIRFVNAFPVGPHRAAAAYQEGAGIEMQALLNTRRRDIVDEPHRVIWAHGEKNEFRDRQVIVDEWAFKIIMAYVKANPMHPDALLFGEITEDTHRARWYDVRDALRAKGVNIPANYKPHSCRNTFAVRGLKDGRDPVLLASNLGHADTSELLRLYGKHRPAITDLVRADQRGKVNQK